MDIDAKSPKIPPSSSATLPVGVLILALALFVTTWVIAPQETLSGEIHPTPVTLRPRQGTAPRFTPRPENHPGQVATASSERPMLVRGFGHPYEIALTFDDGPHPHYTAKVLDILHHYRVKAAFFINGMWLAMDPKGRARAVLTRAYLEGHLIGNHTYSHELLSRLPPAKQTWQIVANELLVSDLIAQRPRIFRPPYGQMTRHATEVLRQYGYQEVLWNIASHEGDAEGDPEPIAHELMMWVLHHKGGIVLLHDRLPASVQATALLLARLRKINCRRLRQGKTLFRVVGLDSFLRSPAESRALAPRRAKARRHFRARLETLCKGQ